MNNIIPDEALWNVIEALSKGIDTSTTDEIKEKLLSLGHITENLDLTDDGKTAQENATKAIKLVNLLSSVGNDL